MALGKTSYWNNVGAVALLNFPPNPVNGEIYPSNPHPDSNVYQWSSADQTWRLAKIGGLLSSGSLVLLDNLTPLFDGNTFTFTLTVGGAAVSPGANLMVFVGGIAQVNGFSYTISGSSITFTSPPPTGSAFIAMMVT